VNTDNIEQAFYTEDAKNCAIEAERLAYINNQPELAKAYALIAELLHYKELTENEYE
jgi:hypothetical protein